MFMYRDIHDYESLRQSYLDLLLFKQCGPVRSERMESYVRQLKHDIREYNRQSSGSRVIIGEFDHIVELIELPAETSGFSEAEAAAWFDANRAYHISFTLGCSGQYFTTYVKLFRRRGRWFAYHFISVDM